MAKEIQKAALFGAWITATVMILNWVLSMLNIPVKQVFGITGATGVTTTIGNKVIAILQNLVAFDIASIVSLYLSAVVIVFVGGFLKDSMKFLPQGKTDWQKTALVLLYGTAAFYLLLVGFGLPSMGTLVGLGVYYGVVAISMGMLQKQLKNFI